MIKKMRLKFIGIMMVIVTILLFIIFTSLFFSSKINFQKSSKEKLISAVKEDYPGGGPPHSHRDGTPVLVISINSEGNMKILKNNFSDITDEEINQLALSVQENKEMSGYLPKEELRYLKERTPSGKFRLAFIDTSIESASLRAQVFHSAIIGIGAFFIFLAASIPLSAWVVHPVQTALEQQRQFIADASHELKTPLTIILSNVGILIETYEMPSPKNLDRLDNIQAEAKRMKQLTESLLLLARFEETRLQSSFVPIHFSHLLQLSLSTFEPVFYDVKKHLTCNLEEELWVDGNEKKLQQLIEILLDNALKYSKNSADVLVSLTRGGKELCFSVTSEGIPIPEQEYSKLFLRFYRSDQSRGEVKGYGLGLSIAYNIAAEHNGKIEVSSDGKSKNTFRIKMPIIEKPHTEDTNYV